MSVASDETPADAAKDFGDGNCGDGFGLFDLPEPQISNISTEVSKPAEGVCVCVRVTKL